jgi:hypothetical protein
MYLFRTHVAGSQVGTVGKMHWKRPSAGVLPQTLEMTLPASFNLTETQGSWVSYNNRKYGAGVGTDNALVDEHFRFLRQGIKPPILVPVLAAGAGPGRSGDCVIALAFYDELTDEWSPLSGSSNEVTLSNQSAVITNVQTTAEERVTHVGVWVSMDGGLYRLSTKRQLGVSTITENIATLALGAAFPDTFTRMPRVTINTIYHERLVGAGDALARDVVYVSAIGKPERYEGLSFKTKNGESIIGIVVAQNDVCLVFTPVNCYVLRGFKDTDMSMTLLDPDAGALNHASIKITTSGRPVVINQQGIWLYNGSFQCITRDRSTEWGEFYKANRIQVEASFAIYDPNRYTFILYVTRMLGQLTVPAHIANPDEISIGSIMWVADMRPVTPQVSGEMGQPHWNIDIMNRTIETAALLTLPGTGRADVYMGFCDGYIRGYDPTDDDDDQDLYGKRIWIRTKAYDMADPGGSIQEGKQFKRVWSYMESEDCEWTVYIRGGDEHAWKTPLPENAQNDLYFMDEKAASLKEYFDDDGNTLTATAQTVHYHPIQRVTGRCLTLDYTLLAPLGIKWRGFGGVFGPGRATRPPALIESDEG